MVKATATRCHQENYRGNQTFFQVALTTQSTLLPLTLPSIPFAITCTSGTTHLLVGFPRENNCLASCVSNTRVSYRLCLCLKTNTLTSLCQPAAVQEGTVHLGLSFCTITREDSVIKNYQQQH